jgi:hypothetical protein
VYLDPFENSKRKYLLEDILFLDKFVYFYLLFVFIYFSLSFICFSHLRANPAIRTSEAAFSWVQGAVRLSLLPLLKNCIQKDVQSLLFNYSINLPFLEKVCFLFLFLTLFFFLSLLFFLGLFFFHLYFLSFFILLSLFVLLTLFVLLSFFYFLTLLLH